MVVLGKVGRVLIGACLLAGVAAAGWLRQVSGASFRWPLHKFKWWLVIENVSERAKRNQRDIKRKKKTNNNEESPKRNRTSQLHRTHTHVMLIC